MSPLNTTTHHLLTAILGTQLIAHVGGLYYIGVILLGVGAISGLWQIFRADWQWLKNAPDNLWKD